MHTTLIRISVLALTLVGAGLAVTSVTAPAQAADDFRAQAGCGSIGGTYQAQTDHHSQQTLSWSCTYSLPGIIRESVDVPPVQLQSVCQGTSSFVAGTGVDVFSCVVSNGS
jgi:hypothetical protein